VDAQAGSARLGLDGPSSNRNPTRPQNNLAQHNPAVIEIQLPPKRQTEFPYELLAVALKTHTSRCEIFSKSKELYHANSITRLSLEYTAAKATWIPQLAPQLARGNGIPPQEQSGHKSS
jgi:hypothetical protein